MNFVELETSRLLLRRLGFEDVYDYYERLGSDGEVTKYLPQEPHQDIGESLSFIEQTQMRYEEGNCWLWAIAERETEELVGLIELTALDETEQCCSFVCMIAGGWWNRGYAGEAAKAVFRFAFEELGLRSVRAEHFAVHAAAAGFLRKAGMTRTGIRPGRYEKQGQHHDAVTWELAGRKAEPLTAAEYETRAMTTLNPALDKQEVLLNAVMGLCGEAGEAIDIVKKHRFQGHELDREKLCRELGDVAWYLAEAAYALEVPLEDILRANLEKLKKRYPQGFDSACSVNRPKSPPCGC